MIALYRQQIKLLSGLLSARPGIEVLTADKSQGRDKDCILMSLVRSNADAQVSRSRKPSRFVPDLRADHSISECCPRLDGRPPQGLATAQCLPNAGQVETRSRGVKVDALQSTPASSALHAAGRTRLGVHATCRCTSRSRICCNARFCSVTPACTALRERAAVRQSR